MSITDASRSHDHGCPSAFDDRVQAATKRPLHGMTLETVQVNVGLRCNLACRHCHVESSPKRSEAMSWETMTAVLEAARLAGARKLDVTGGAPEMHPHLRELIDAALAQGMAVMVRTNLTIMLEPAHDDFPRFFAERGVHLVASLPCYRPEDVEKQRGKRVFAGSIEVIQRLNRLGYGRDDDKQLDLVYNPQGPALPPPQGELEEAYRVALQDAHGIRFNRLFTITNMAIGRFLHDLQRQGLADGYRQLLRDAFNERTLDDLMCRHQLHVGWDGTMYDCDFNLAAGLPVSGPQRHVRDFDPHSHRGRPIVTGEHCFACTAGSGSSCCGALT